MDYFKYCPKLNAQFVLGLISFSVAAYLSSSSHIGFAADALNELNLGVLAESLDGSTVVDSRPDVLPSQIFGIAVNGKTTFTDVWAKLGKTYLQRLIKDEGTGRFVCYRSSRSKPAVVVVFIGNSLVKRDVIDEVAFGLQSSIPDATKVCKSAGWLQASRLRFEKVWLGMPREQLLTILGQTPSNATNDKVIVMWTGPEQYGKSGSSDWTASDLVVVSAIFQDSKLVFFRAIEGTRFR